MPSSLIQRKIAHKRAERDMSLKRNQELLEDLPMKVSPKVAKQIMKYQWVVYVITALMLFGLYLVISPMVYRRIWPEYYAALEAPGGEFDFFVLSTQWPATVCMHTTNGACSDPMKLSRSGFVINGFYPETVNGSISYCKGDGFRPGMLYDMQLSLMKYWPSLNKRDNRQFWKFEWAKHGTCSLSQFHNQSEYFSSAVQLRLAVDAQELLAQHDIYPSETAKYGAEQIIGALKAEVNANPILRCYQDESGIYLQQVWFCVDKTVLSVMECPVEWESKSFETCPKGDGKISYPVLRTSFELGTGAEENEESNKEGEEGELEEVEPVVDGDEEVEQDALEEGAEEDADEFTEEQQQQQQQEDTEEDTE